MSKRLPIRQQSLATAQVYLKRFYSQVEIRRTNPYLVITTALYLANKMEESPQHIRLMLTEARHLWQDFIVHDASKIGECEFFLISEMSSQLIVYQPYRTLSALRPVLFLMEDEVQLAKTVINDHYMTDLPLLFPPHTIALVAILLALIHRPSTMAQGQTNVNPGVGINNLAAMQIVFSRVQRETAAPKEDAMAGMKQKLTESKAARLHNFAFWLAESDVDIASMIDATQEMVSFYQCQEQYNDKVTREQVNRFVKARGLDK